MKNKRLIIFGDSAFAEIAYEYFTYDSEYEVAGFTVTNDFLKNHEMFGLPVVPFEEIELDFPPSSFHLFVALTYAQMNRVRERFYLEAKAKGYTLATYVSSKAFVWRNVHIGDNVFIFEDNTVQPYVSVGNNVIMWSGNHIGHHSDIGNNCFISSHVVISGFCKIGHNTFLGVNSAINNNIKVAENNLIGSGCLLVKDTLPGEIYRGPRSNAHSVSVYEKFNIEP